MSKEEHEGDGLANLLIESLIDDAKALLARANQCGLVLTIVTEAKKPLAMGNYEYVINLRAGKRLYRGEK